MEYTVDYFIGFFSVIPDQEWCTGTFINETNQCCARGHLLARNMTRAECELLKMFREEGNTVAHINDGNSPYYQQATPKARILAALNDIKTKQYEQK